MKLGFQHKAGIRRLNVLDGAKVAFGVDMVDEELSSENLAECLRMLADKLDGRKTRFAQPQT